MSEEKVETVTITKDEYIQLLNDSIQLATLQSYGVDNWEGYGPAMQDFEEITELEEENDE